MSTRRLIVALALVIGSALALAAMPTRHVIALRNESSHRTLGGRILIENSDTNVQFEPLEPGGGATLEFWANVPGSHYRVELQTPGAGTLIQQCGYLWSVMHKWTGFDVVFSGPPWTLSCGPQMRWP